MMEAMPMSTDEPKNEGPPPGENARSEHEVLSAVWEEHGDETYRRDQSHWRGEGRWDDESWAAVGQTTRGRVGVLARLIRYPFDRARSLLEWGPGGGSNLLAFSHDVERLVGVDISSKNLAESARVVNEAGGAVFHGVHLTGSPADVIGMVGDPVDIIISTAVFQHFPSKAYGVQVLEAMRPMLKAGGLGYIQMRFDNGNPKYAPKTLREYERSHITATSYDLSEFWDLLGDAGFSPRMIGNVATRNNYATFYFTG